MKLKTWLLAAAASVLAFGPACAQDRIRYTATDGVNGVNVSVANPLPVTGSFSATFAGFTPTAGAVANLSVTTTSTDVALPAGATVVVTNSGSTDAAFRIQTGAGTAVTTDQIIKAGAAIGLAPGAATHLSAITASGSTTLNIQGGAGGAAGYGGGGSGGGGAITAASGSFASGSISTGAFAAGSLGSGALAAGAGVDGWDLTEGAKGDTAYAGSGSASLVALGKGLYNAATAALPAGANLIGKVGIDQTTPGTTNGVQVNAALPTGANVIGGITVADGSDATLGAKANAACSTDNGTCAVVDLVKRGNQNLTTLTTAVNGATPAGTNVIGKVGIDQTTPGTTNLVISGPLPYASTQTPETASSGNVANASAVATLATAVGKTTYISGFSCQAAGATAASVVSLTVAGVITGTMTYTFVFPAGATTAATPVSKDFSRPIPASTTNTTIVVTLPAGGTGNTNASCDAYGFQQ